MNPAGPTEHQSRSALASSLTHLLHRACQVADSVFNEEAGTTGLTTRQFAVLVAVANNRDVSQTGLVQATGIDRSTVAEIVKRLLRRGLVRRKRTRLDARAYAVRLTDEGEAVLNQAATASSRAEARLRNVFEGGDVTGIKSALTRLVEAYPAAK